MTTPNRPTIDYAGPRSKAPAPPVANGRRLTACGIFAAGAMVSTGLGALALGHREGPSLSTLVLLASMAVSVVAVILFLIQYVRGSRNRDERTTTIYTSLITLNRRPARIAGGKTGAFSPCSSPSQLRWCLSSSWCCYDRPAAQAEGRSAPVARLRFASRKRTGEDAGMGTGCDIDALRPDPCRNSLGDRRVFDLDLLLQPRWLKPLHRP
jgi:hypothetical protein